VPEWKIDLAEANVNDIGTLVPPVLDFSAALIYSFVGEEFLWIPRLLSAIFWLIGGAFLLSIAKKIMTIDAAIVSLSFYLLLPFGVLASQSFQPDSLMVMLMLVGISIIIKFDDNPSWGMLLFAAFASSIAVLIKPVSLPILLLTFLALRHYRVGLRDTFFNRQTLIFIIIMLSPTVLYYGYNILLVGGQLRQQADKSFVPKYFLEFRFWDGLLKRIRIVMGYTYLLGGIVGALLYRERRTRALMIGLWAGYFLMCFAFNYTAGTHDYYHLPLIPIVALSIGSIAMAILTYFQRKNSQGYRNAMFLGVLAVAFFLAAGSSVQARRKFPEFDSDIKIAQTIGAEVNHSIRTIHLAPYQGFPLMYYGELSGIYWPYWYDIRDEELWEGRSLTAEERFELLLEDYSPDYFIVADKEEFMRQEDLNDLLTQRFSTFVETEEYIIFDLQ
jgi:hypothetical protein